MKSVVVEEQDLELLLKKSNALEIINEKWVDIRWLKESENCSKYNLGVGTTQHLKRTEYLLLKEILV